MQTKFKKFNKVPLLISLLFFGLSIGVFVFLYKNIKSNNEISEKAATESQIEASRKAEIKSLDRSLKATEAERALIDTHFVKASDVVPLLDTIEKMAPLVKAKAQITLVDISSDNASLSVSMNVTGTFESQYKFLTLLENSVYPIEILSMDLQKVSDETVDTPVETVPAPAPVTTPTPGDTTTTPLTLPEKPIVTPKVTKVPQWSAVYKIKLSSFIKS